MTTTADGRRAHTPIMKLKPRRVRSAPSKRMEIILASLLLNAGVLLALITWITADQFDRWAWIANDQVRSAASIAGVGLPVTLVASLTSRLSKRLPALLGTRTLLMLITSLSALFTAAALIHTLLPWDGGAGLRSLHSLINLGVIFLMARLFVRCARTAPDWISIIGTIFSLGLLPLALLTLLIEAASLRPDLPPITDLPLNREPDLLAVLLAAIYLAGLLPTLFFGRELLRTESSRYRPLERRFVDVLTSFGVGMLAATLLPVATTRLYDALQQCTSDYVCDRPPAEWVIIGLLTGFAAWQLIREAERNRQPLLWVGAIPPVITTAIAINWYLPAQLGGLPIAGALIALGGLILLRRATITPAPPSRRAAQRR